MNRLAQRLPGHVLRLVLLTALSAACESQAEKEAANLPPALVPAEFQTGESKFAVFCAACHGAGATGTSLGPPLVHKIYEPNHHPDVAFQRAAANGVRAHHWQFGNMPKIEGVASEDVGQIIKYVRWLQRQAGIF